MISFHASDIRATLWPRRLIQVRRTLNRSSLIIIFLGLTALCANAAWVWLNRKSPLPAYPVEWSSGTCLVYLNSVLFAVVLLYAMRQISRTRQKLITLGYPLLERVRERRGMETWKSVEPLTKRPTMLHVIHADKFPHDAGGWKALSHQWIKRGEKAKRLTSPHVARVLDCGFADHERFYSAMEMPKGISMEALVQYSGPCPPARAVYLLAQVAHALEDAHAHDFTLIQLEPSSVFIGSRASNYDWVTVIFSGYELAGSPDHARHVDTLQFVNLAIGLFTGKWPQPDSPPHEMIALPARRFR